MAQQLILDRTPAGYAGIESYARAHAKEDAGALAWLVVGYAHILDHEYAKAIDPLNRAKPLAGDLGDYVAYYLGTCYLQTGRQAEGLAALANFGTTYPDSLLIRDAHLSYRKCPDRRRPSRRSRRASGERSPARKVRRRACHRQGLCSSGSERRKQPTRSRTSTTTCRPRLKPTRRMPS